MTISTTHNVCFDLGAISMLHFGDTLLYVARSALNPGAGNPNIDCVAEFNKIVIVEYGL
jgi:hypothetical protein